MSFQLIYTPSLCTTRVRISVRGDTVKSSCSKLQQAEHGGTRRTGSSQGQPLPAPARGMFSAPIIVQVWCLIAPGQGCYYENVIIPTKNHGFNLKNMKSIRRKKVQFCESCQKATFCSDNQNLT